MLPDRVSNPGPLTYESGALPIAPLIGVFLPHTYFSSLRGWSGGAMVLGKLSGAGASYLFGLE